MRKTTLRHAFLAVAAMGCEPQPSLKEREIVDGATDWSLIQDTGEPSQESTPSEDTSDSAPYNIDCPQPDSCISLAEAMDRDFATLSYYDGVVVKNTGPYDICAGRWHTYFSETSQDAIAGNSEVSWPAEPEDAYEIPAGESWTHDYARFRDGPAWWCIERTQVTANGSALRFTGARAPTPLMSYVHTETDTNLNGVEDHVDYADTTTGAPWTNNNIWNHLAATPTYVVGRLPNYVELRPGESAPLTIEIVNLGRSSSTVQVTEHLPAGTRAYGFTVRPTTTTVHDDGSTTHVWSFKMAGATDDEDLSAPTDYDIVNITYQVVWDRPDCGYRQKGSAPEVTWTDDFGTTSTSYGTELILVCCDG